MVHSDAEILGHFGRRTRPVGGARSGLGRRAALERGLRQAIRSGRLQPGTRLPSSRTLAHDVGLARGTVSEAYRQLVAEGYVVARQGAGTTVAHALSVPVFPLVPAPRVRQVRWDLRPGQPDLSSFPRDLWLAATRRVLRTAGSDRFGYADPRGRPELRRALADYLGRARGVLTSPDLIVVCSGYVQGLALLCQALRGRGAASVAHEDPCLPDYPATMTGAGLQPGGVAVDAGGLQVDRLAELGADAVVVTPAHQFPLGPTLAAARRAELVRWARVADALVIEDDYDGEFRYDRQPVGAVQGLDPERVAYAGTASKTLAPALRLAWLALPPWLLEPVVEAKRLADRHSAVLDQLVLADLIVSGAFDRHVRRCRLRYRRRPGRRLRDPARARLHPRAGRPHRLPDTGAPGPSGPSIRWDPLTARVKWLGLVEHIRRTEVPEGWRWWPGRSPGACGTRPSALPIPGRHLATTATRPSP
jgi:GntR family transcriptional regulator / MocR family aminotransferase